jgi:superfamily II DNA helicase RecQ
MQLTTHQSILALGRGFHDSNIRYIFHVFRPLSLRDYIQETGRGGRDSKKTYCIMFFSSFDRCMAEKVVGLSGGLSEKRLEDYEQGNVEDAFKKVTAYAMSGKECQYSMLAKAVALEEAVPIAQSCKKEAMCDNCCTHFLGSPSMISASKVILASSKAGASSLEFLLKKREVSRIIADSLSEVLELAKTKELIAEVEVEKCIKERVSVRYQEEDHEEEKRLLATLIITGGREPGTGANKSLLLEFVRDQVIAM